MAKREYLEEDSSWDLLSPSAARGEACPATKQRNILVIENDDADYWAIERCVRKAQAVDLRLDRAVALSEGLARLTRGDIDIVLLDLGLPDSQGLETLQRVRSQAPHVPIIVLTGVDDAEAALQAVRKGAQDYLAKGEFDPRVLVRSIRYSIARNRYRERLTHLLQLTRASEANLQNIITRNADGMVVVDERGLIQFSNPAAQVMVGCSPKELMGSKFGYPLTRGEATEVEIIQSQRQSIPAEMRVVELSWEGKAAYLVVLHDLTQQKHAEEELRKHREELEDLVESRTGELAKANEGLRREIAERKRTEQTLRASEKRFRQVAENALEWIWEVDADGLYTYASPASEKILGYAPEEIVGKRCFYDQLHPEDRERVEKNAFEVFAEKRPFREFINRNVHCDGHTVWLLTSGVPMLDEDGSLLGYRGVDTDITERVLAEEELKKHHERLEELVEQRTAELGRSNKELQQFATIVSHDLQEPLRTIRSYLELLQMKFGTKLGSNADEFVGYVVDGAERMQRMIDDLLAYSRVSTRGKPFESVDVNAVVDEVKGNLGAAISEHNVRVTRDDLPTIPCDRRQLVQLFQNLVSNSIKFHGEERPKIHVSAKPVDAADLQDSKRLSRFGSRRYWEFSVEDNGIGIAPKYHDRVFEVFGRLHTREEYPGSGIGL